MSSSLRKREIELPGRIARSLVRWGLAVVLGLALPGRGAAIEWEPARSCGEAEYEALLATLQVKCARREELSCLDAEGCVTLRSIKREFAGCRDANNILNQLCYGGGSIPLQVEVVSIHHQIEICEERIALPFPFGCGRDCP